MTTFESVQKILKENLDISPDAVKLSTTLEDLAIDSLSLIEVMFAVEETFKINVPDAPAATQTGMKTVSDLVGYIDHLIAEQRLGQTTAVMTI